MQKPTLSSVKFQNGKHSILRFDLFQSAIKSDIFCTQFHPYENYIAFGRGDGIIMVHNSTDGKAVFRLEGPPQPETLPITSIHWRPHHSDENANILLATGADGTVRVWNATSAKLLHDGMEQNNSVLCSDYFFDGRSYVTAGNDTKLRIYNSETNKLETTLTRGYSDEFIGHTNRVFSVVCHPNDANLLISAGWDETVLVWDRRTARSVRNIWGPRVCGDSIDIHPNGNTILTGSWRGIDNVELWDMRTGKNVLTLDWDVQSTSTVHSEPPITTSINYTTTGTIPPIGTKSFVYSAKFGKNGKFVIACGSGANEGAIFDPTINNQSSGKNDKTDVIVRFGPYAHPLFCCHMNKTGTMLALAGLQIAEIHDIDQAL